MNLTNTANNNNIKNLCRKRFEETIKEIMIQNQRNSTDFILILDKFTKKILSGLFTINQIHNMKILVLEKLELQRKPFQTSNSIYYISPTQESINRLFKDFQDKNQPKYFSINLLFSDEISQQLMKQIGQNNNIIKRISTFQQFHLDLFFLFDHIISLQMQKCLQFEKNDKNFEKIIKNLQFFINSFQNNGTINIHYLKSQFSQNIALGLSKRLKQQKIAQNQSEKQNVTIIIADRTIDPVSPLVRNFYYDPMLRDLLQAQNNKITVKNKIQLIDDKDSIYLKFRNKHISIALSQIAKDLKYFTQNDQTAKFHRGETQNFETTLTQIPQYNKKINSYNFNITIMNNLLDLYNKKSLNKLADLEYTIISGLNSQNHEQSQKIIVSKCFQQLNKLTQLQDKSRLIMIMIMCLDLKTNDKQALIKQLKSNSTNYQNIQKGLAKICSKKIKLKQRKKTKQEQGLILNRHQPKLSEVLLNIVNKKSDPNFKSLIVNQTENKTMAKKSKIGEKKNQNKERIIVFLYGGLGFNQISIIEKNDLKQDLYFIGTKIYNPQKYLNQIALVRQ